MLYLSSVSDQPRFSASERAKNDSNKFRDSDCYKMFTHKTSKRPSFTSPRRNETSPLKFHKLPGCLTHVQINIRECLYILFLSTEYIIGAICNWIHLNARCLRKDDVNSTNNRCKGCLHCFSNPFSAKRLSLCSNCWRAPHCLLLWEVLD